MNPDALCSCGSGKQHKFCCGKAPASISVKVGFTWFLIGLLVSGITAMALFMPNDSGVTDNALKPNLSLGVDSNILNPKPWQYDPIKDQHWHATANPHWDPGPSPISSTSTNPLLSKPLLNQPNLSSRPVPDIDNPQPWQYDPITDQHWHATAYPHWDAGLPPDNPGQ